MSDELLHDPDGEPGDASVSGVTPGQSATPAPTPPRPYLPEDRRWQTTAAVLDEPYDEPLEEPVTEPGVVPGDASGPDGAVPADAVATAPRPLWQRALLRVVRRPRTWIEAPWPTERIVRVITAFLLVGGATWAAMQSVHPDLILSNNTPTGGDMGAHVMGPAFLRDHLLPNLKLTGWSNYWYAGFPMYRFYMVIPALMIVAINVVLPYGVAFKIVAVLGIVTLPFCCWAFGRLAAFRYPIPELMGLAGLLFLFDESFSIYGGNVKSTMAGEFSFSIALSLGILGLGLFAKGLQTGKYRNWAAIVLALACLSHGIVLIFVLGSALLMWLVWMDRTRAVYGVTVLVTAGLLMSFWVVPFLFNHAYMTDMKYGFRPDGSNDSFWKMFFPLTSFYSIFITTFAIIGFVASIVRRHLNGAWLGITCLALVAGVYVTRDSLPIIGLLWNPRLLPFIYLVRYLLMMVGIVETVTFVVRGVKNQRYLTARQAFQVGTTVALVVGVGVLIIEGMFFRVLPGGGMASLRGKQVYHWGPIYESTTAGDALSDAWSRYNFTGYEEKPAYGEYRKLVQTMEALGKDPANGCGRALWENNEATGQYGTTMSLMLLPHWTDGCIGSMEGLFFEASGTTPYHFLTAAAMSQSSSNPVRGLRYDNNNAAIGVPYLQDLGVKYVMVFTDKAKQQADSRPELTLVATSGPWKIYSVAGSDLVVPLKRQPVVVNARGGDQRERNLELGTSWFQHTSEWAAMPADDGPKEWQRIDVDVDTTRIEKDRVNIVVPRQQIQVVDEPEIQVSNVKLGEQTMDFDVSQIGVPVLVKISYFPNWEVDGAQGVYRIAPNLMVVVPTSTHVHMYFGRSATDIGAYVLTAIGIVLLCFWRFRKGDVMHASDGPFGVAPAAATTSVAPAAIGPEPWVVDPGGPPLGPLPGTPSAGPWPTDLDETPTGAPAVVAADGWDDGPVDEPAPPATRPADPTGSVGSPDSV